MTRQPYRDFDDKIRALPMVTYENRWMRLRGSGLDLKLPSAGPISFRLRANYSPEGYEADDSPYLQGMAERKGGFWVGGAASWRTELGDLSAELLTDASGVPERALVPVARRCQGQDFGLADRL